MKNRDNRLYANKIDYLMDTNDASNVFSGHNKYQTILFIGIIIFVIMLIVCLFGKFLGLNSHFQNILATVNKITARIKTLLPAALPVTVQAATITHGDVSLHIDYFEILLYAIQIMIVMGVLYAIVWFIVQIWNCVNTRNLGNLENLEFVPQQHPDYNSYQDLIIIMFQGLVERKITPAMVYHWLTHQMFWSLCQYEDRREC